MANVKFSRKEFEKHIKLSKEIEEKISMFGTPIESLTENEIEIEIFPNRPDLLSLHGYLRSFLAFLGKKSGKKYKLEKPEKNFQVTVDSSVKDVRPFTACAIVKNLKFNDEKIKEIIDIQEKLHSTIGRNRKKVAIGIYPLEKISLPIRYEARKPEDIKFQPLESSEESREMTGREILQRTSTGRDYAHLLEGKEKFPVFVDNKGEILSMPPIINSHNTGKITGKTTSVFIECSGFDFSVLKKTLNILVTMLSDMGGKVYQMKLKHLSKTEITPDLESEKMKINPISINKLLGLNLSEQEIKKLLEKMNYAYKNKEVEIPAYRTDILHEVDIAEDIAIAYGYEKFELEIPNITGIGEEDVKEIFKRKISEILVGLGLLETSSYHLLTKEDTKKANNKASKEEIEVEESKTDYKVLRSQLLISSLKILSENVDTEYPQKIFEIGKIFKKDENPDTGIRENTNLVIALTPSNFTELKQVLDYLGKMLEKEFEVEETSNPLFIEGRTGKILHKSKEIGILGEIHPQVLKSWHLKMPLAVLEMNIDELI